MSIFGNHFKVKTVQPEQKCMFPAGWTYTPNCRAYLVKIELEIAEAILTATENLLKDPSKEAIGRLDGLHMALRIARCRAHDYEQEVKANKPTTPFPPSVEIPTF